MSIEPNETSVDPSPSSASAPPPPTGIVPGSEKKMVSGILAILLGALGIHKFYLGYQKEGIIMLVVGLVGAPLCGIPTAIVGIIGLVEGILYLTKSDQEFVDTYITGRKSWF